MLVNMCLEVISFYELSKFFAQFLNSFINIYFRFFCIFADTFPSLIVPQIYADFP